MLVQLALLTFCVVGIAEEMETATFSNNDTLFLSRTVGTAEGDEFQMFAEVEKKEGKEIIHTTRNHNESQTVVTIHSLGIRVMIPDSELEVCSYIEFTDEEKTESAFEETYEGAVSSADDAINENVNASEETSCMLEEDDDIPEPLRSDLTELCGARRIVHFHSTGECQDIPQNGTQIAEESEESTSGELIRKKRWWRRYRYRCVWISRKVCYGCRYRRSCWFIFCTYRRKCSFCLSHYYKSCGYF